jgi:hypothetical protein
MPSASYMPANLKPGAMQQLGQTLRNTFDMFEKDRKPLEDQYLRNLRQFRGIYDPEIESHIPDDQSMAYPKITRNKVIGTVARLMEMLFPRTDENYEVTNSPMPNLSTADLQKVLDTLVAENPGVDLTDDKIEHAIVSFAAEKAKRLQAKVRDQLTEMDYVKLAKRIVFSGVLYGCGLMKGPFVLKEDARTWTKNAEGRYVATPVVRNKPGFDTGSVWDYYTDLSAKSLDATDADCWRHILTRTQLLALRERPDFMPEAIDAYLRSHTTGNWKEKHWETSLRVKSNDRSNVINLSGRKYEAIEYWGRVTGQQLKDCGVAVPDEKLQEEVEANFWMLDNFIIKAVLNPYDGRIRGVHHFIYEEDDINLLGNGLPVVMRDSQMAICESARMVLDNGSVVCGGMYEVNESFVKPGSDLDIYARKVWLREDIGVDANIPAVRQIPVDSHINELIQIIDLFQGFADAETALPPPALGDVSGQGKESLRTTGNLSMLLGAAALPIRDTVRNFDKFTVSFISSLCYWYMEFGNDESIKGDFNVIARGSTSLIAKEVRAQSIAQLSTTLTPDERIYISTEQMVKEKLKVLDLPETMLEDKDVVKAKLAEQARNAAATAQMSTAMSQAQIKGEVAAAFKDLMLGLKAQAGANADVFNSIVEGMINVRAANESDTAGGGGAPAKGARPQSRSGVAGAS